MKSLKLHLLVLLMVAFTFACQRSEHTLVLTNDSPFDRVDEPVIITRADFEKQTGKIAVGLVPMLSSENGEVIPSQVDDLDGDGEWDELFLLANISANSNISMKVKLVNPEALPVFTQRSNIWLASPQDDGSFLEVKKADRPAISRENHGQTRYLFQFEGPGWENDLVGFRNYFDERNGMDIFGKTTEAMVLKKVGIDEDYHALQDWGMDILKVGASLGAGSIALEVNGKLHRVAPGSQGSFELVANGPLRSILRFRFDNWEVENSTCSVVHEITIYGGAWYYVSKVSVEGIEDANIVTGITTIDLEEKQAAFTDFENGIVSLSTHGQQAIEGEYLGMAVMLAKADYLGFEYLDENAEDINHTFMVRMNSGEKPAKFKFYSAWELSDPNFASAEGFEEMLKADALKMGSQVKVAFK
ncbi:MAG: DUF4861 domain-containing protein [Bacteroidales bacterium]|nr:DUF4861 domain-containing protein [Bacteroidales bacterium]